MEKLFVAILIIAIVEVVRMLQNCIQIRNISRQNSDKYMEKALDAFVKSLERDMDFYEDK